MASVCTGVYDPVENIQHFVGVNRHFLLVAYKVALVVGV